MTFTPAEAREEVATLGDTVTLTFTLNRAAQRDEAVEWKKGSVKIETGDAKSVTMDDSKMVHTLVINALAEQDLGAYTLSVGSQQSFAQTIVQPGEHYCPIVHTSSLSSYFITSITITGQ